MRTKCLSLSNNCKPKDLVDFGLFPIANFPINKKTFKNFIEKNKFNSKKKLKIIFCPKCNYLQLEKKASPKALDTIYEKFYKYPSAMLGQIDPIRDDLFLKKIFKVLNFKKINSVLEIGCYDGYILHNIKKKYPSIDEYGCEPSSGANIAKRFNLNVRKTFFDKKTFKNKKFDLIILRHTLEHIYDIKKILSNIKSVMNENSYFAIEVPNTNFYLKKGLLEVFSFQHVHYFSSKSFYVISKDYNFLIYKYYETPENLIFILKKNNNRKNNKNKIFQPFYAKKFLLKIKQNYLKIKKITSQYSNDQIALWGAGGFAVAAINLYKIPISSKTLIIDKDPSKHGLTFSNNDSKITNISKKILKKKKLIIITSYYSSQIIRDIKKLNIKIDIMKIFPRIIFKKIKL